MEDPVVDLTSSSPPRYTSIEDEMNMAHLYDAAREGRLLHEATHDQLQKMCVRLGLRKSSNRYKDVLCFRLYEHYNVPMESRDVPADTLEKYEKKIKLQRKKSRQKRARTTSSSSENDEEDEAEEGDDDIPPSVLKKKMSVSSSVSSTTPPPPSKEEMEKLRHTMEVCSMWVNKWKVEQAAARTLEVEMEAKKQVYDELSAQATDILGGTAARANDYLLKLIRMNEERMAIETQYMAIREVVDAMSEHIRPVLNSITSTSNGEERMVGTCHVCYEPFTSKLPPHTLMSCGHTFCLPCIQKMKRKKKECAVCRKPMVTDEDDPVPHVRVYIST
jgi:hypothetical protein